jgi:hypothetical protein
MDPDVGGLIVAVSNTLSHAEMSALAAEAPTCIRKRQASI